MPNVEALADSARAPANFAKQAVIVIHGMGEQMPMDTLRGFVRAVWETDPEITANGMPQPAAVWSKPDQRTGSLELRRITTRQSVASESFPGTPGEPRSGGVRTDFYELYWADLSGGSTLQQVEDWIVGLLLRNPWTRVPPSVFSAWLFLWIVSLLVVYLLLAPIVTPEGQIWSIRPYQWMAHWPSWGLTAIGVLLGWLASRYLVPYFGRVVRYTRATPENIAARRDIRDRGLALLDALHHDRDYQRIIVVGHSLGSILAYDLITYFWAMRLAPHTVVEGGSAFEELREVEIAVAEVEQSRTSEALARFRRAQRDFCRALRLRQNVGPADPRWLITDLVTLGSPLTHADFLLTSDAASLQERIESREYPVAPPVREILDSQYFEPAEAAGLPLLPKEQPRLLSFKFPPANWQTHHAAPFAAVRWTNIYDPARFIFCGDIISGPLAPKFGAAIVDINLAEKRGQAWTFTHTDYWRLDSWGGAAAPHIVALRNALDLAGKNELV